MLKKNDYKYLDLKINSLNIFDLTKGNVLHFLKSGDSSFNEFGEVYFSWLKMNCIKAWKKHLNVTMNLVVPVGMVKCIFFREEKMESFFSIDIGEKNYKRITVPPNIWYGFQNKSQKDALIVNLIDKEHNKSKVENKSIDLVNYKWL